MWEFRTWPLLIEYNPSTSGPVPSTSACLRRQLRASIFRAYLKNYLLFLISNGKFNQNEQMRDFQKRCLYDLASGKCLFLRISTSIFSPTRVGRVEGFWTPAPIFGWFLKEMFLRFIYQAVASPMILLSIHRVCSRRSSEER